MVRGGRGEREEFLDLPSPVPSRPPSSSGVEGSKSRREGRPRRIPGPDAGKEEAEAEEDEKAAEAPASPAPPEESEGTGLCPASHASVAGTAPPCDIGGGGGALGLFHAA